MRKPFVSALALVAMLALGLLAMTTQAVEKGVMKSSPAVGTEKGAKPPPSRAIQPESAATSTRRADSGQFETGKAPDAFSAEVGVPVTASAVTPSVATIPWQSINGGGGPASSPNYRTNGSVGQSMIGHAVSTNYHAGIGYWYGVPFATCACSHQADFDASGFIDAVDLAIEIDIVFFGSIDPQDPSCPATRGEFNCDGFTDAVDLAEFIDHVFFGGAGPCDPCRCNLYPTNCP